jgi:hypothetical protein
VSRRSKKAASFSVAKGDEYGTRKNFDRTVKELTKRFSTDSVR